MILRPEAPTDITAIRALTIAAFKGRSYSDQTEHLIIERLREEDMLKLSLVAAIDDAIVGHIAFSPVTLSSGAKGWFGLGPLSVAPERQRHGIGTKLVRDGIERLSEDGAAGCVLAGSPGYYGRFGFQNDKGLTARDIPPQYFMALVLHGPSASGIVAYDNAFYGDAA